MACFGRILLATLASSVAAAAWPSASCPAFMPACFLPFHSPPCGERLKFGSGPGGQPPPGQHRFKPRACFGQVVSPRYLPEAAILLCRRAGLAHRGDVRTGMQRGWGGGQGSQGHSGGYYGGGVGDGGMEGRYRRIDGRVGSSSGRYGSSPRQGSRGGRQGYAQRRGDTRVSDGARNDRRKPWERGDDGAVEVDVDDSTVLEILAKRETCKRRKEFDEADQIRDMLLEDYKIHVDDRRRLWWPQGAWPRDEIDLAELDAGASSGAARVFAFGQGGRDDANERGPGVVQQFGWSRGPPLQNEVPLEEEDIFELLGARDAARRAKDFEVADELMKDLTDLGVGFLEDRSKTWFPAQGQGRASSHPGARIGDWECPDCGALVYASKQACYRCGAERPAGARSGGGERGEGLSRQRQAPLSDPRFPPFTRLQGDSAEVEVDVEQVEAMIEEREQARKKRDYERADAIRAELEGAFGVAVDDGTRQWWASARVRAGQQRRTSPNQGRFGSKMPYVRNREVGNLEHEVNEARVLDLLEQREEARKYKDWTEADRLRDVLQNDLGVAVDDETREWWVGHRKDNRDAKFGGVGRQGQGWGGAMPGRGGGGVRGGGGLGARAGGNRGWSRAPDQGEMVDEGMIMNLILSRDEARAARDFDAADQMREVLRQDWGVTVNDLNREWWVGNRNDDRSDDRSGRSTAGSSRSWGQYRGGGYERERRGGSGGGRRDGGGGGWRSGYRSRDNFDYSKQDLGWD